MKVPSMNAKGQTPDQATPPPSLATLCSKRVPVKSHSHLVRGVGYSWGRGKVSGSG